MLYSLRCRATTLFVSLALVVMPGIVRAQMESTGKLLIVHRGQKGGGTLFCVGKQGPHTYFLTARHCAEPGAALSGEFFRDDADQTRYAAIPALEIVAADEGADIAVLRAK